MHHELGCPQSVSFGCPCLTHAYELVQALPEMLLMSKLPHVPLYSL